MRLSYPHRLSETTRISRDYTFLSGQTSLVFDIAFENRARIDHAFTPDHHHHHASPYSCAPLRSAHVLPRRRSPAIYRRRTHSTVSRNTVWHRHRSFSPVQVSHVVPRSHRRLQIRPCLSPDQVQVHGRGNVWLFAGCFPHSTLQAKRIRVSKLEHNLTCWSRAGV